MLTEIWPTEYVDEFISLSEADVLRDLVRALPYRTQTARGRTLKRRQCDFGATYAPSGKITPADPIPAELAWIRDRTEEHCAARFQQLIVTWYPAGAGIGRHVDDVWFGEPIAGLSLGGIAKLRGRHRSLGVVDRLLAPRSLYVMRGAERFTWTHEIPPVRDERWSFTFRTLTDDARERLAIQ